MTPPAPDNYAQLFNIRGGAYHAAMATYPHARDDEFRTVLALADIGPGAVVADIPCGGGYLANHLGADIELWSIDSSDVFADCFRRQDAGRFLQAPIDAVPLADGHFDHIVSIAGLHHVADRRSFWQECQRLLKPGGRLTIADVRRDSAVARFLDGTVDRYTSTGHRGIYFDDATVAELTAAGFTVTLSAAQPIRWRAADAWQLADFCRLLFGLENIDNATLQQALAQEVGVDTTTDGVALAWELMSYVAIRAGAPD